MSGRRRSTLAAAVVVALVGVLVTSAWSAFAATGPTIKIRTVRVSGTAEGQAFSGSVATFTDKRTPAATAGDYTATVNWGDGSPVASATVSGPVGGPFTASAGPHVYAEDGTYTVSATITQTASPSNTASANGSASVDTVPLNVTCAIAPGKQPQSFSGPVVKFTHDNAFEPGGLGAFAVAINWGDGSPVTAGTVGGSSPSYTVTGSHVYATPGTKVITATVTDDGETRSETCKTVVGSSKATAPLVHVGLNPAACTGPFSGGHRGKVNASFNAALGNESIDVFVHGALPSTTYVVDIRCLHSIGSITTDAHGVGAAHIVIPAVAMPPGTFYVDISVAGGGGGAGGYGDTFIAGPFTL